MPRVSTCTMAEFRASPRERLIDVFRGKVALTGPQYVNALRAALNLNPLRRSGASSDRREQHAPNTRDVGWPSGETDGNRHVRARF